MFEKQEWLRFLTKKKKKRKEKKKKRKKKKEWLRQLSALPAAGILPKRTLVKDVMPYVLTLSRG